MFGQQQTAGNDPWIEANVGLSAYSDSIVSVSWVSEVRLSREICLWTISVSMKHPPVQTQRVGCGCHHGL